MTKPVHIIQPGQVWILAILVIATVLRFYHYSSFSFSNDELSAINRLRFNTFSELVKGGFYVDGHPGGIQVFLWYWSKWFGTTETSLRFPFVVFGILTVLFSYLVAKRMFGLVAGLFTAASLAFLQFPLLFSQIARPYGSGIFFCLLMVYFWLNAVFGRTETDSKPHYSDYAGYSIATALCMYNHYFSFLFAGIVGISGLFLLRKEQIVPYLLAGIAACLLFVPHIYITLNHFSYKGVGLWLGKPGLLWPFQHFYYILNESLITVFLFFIVSVLLSWKGKDLKNKPVFFRLTLSWFLLPLFIGFGYSTLINPVLQNSVLLFSFPFLIMLLFMAAGNEFGKMQQLLLGIFLAAGLAGTILISQYYNTQHFGEFKGIAVTTEKWDEEFGADSISRVVVANSPFYIEYYLNRSGYSTRFEMYDIRTANDLEKLGKIVQASRNPYFLYAWTKPAPEGVDDLIRSKFPYIRKSIHYGTLSQITLYSRTAGTLFEPALEVKPLFHDLMDFDQTGDTRFDNGKLIDLHSKTGSFSYSVDSLTEFSCGFEKKMDPWQKEDALIIVASVDVFPALIPSGAMLVTSLETADGKPLIWESASVDFISLSGEWNRVQHSMKVKGSLCKGAKLKVYFWNKGRKSFCIDNLEYTIYKIGNHSPFVEEERVWGDL